MKDSKPNKKTLIGTVVSDKMEKGVTVRIETRKRHPLYRKFVKQYMKVKAHDSKNDAAAGDLVKLVETRPISKEKCWRVIEILEKVQKG